MLGCVSEDFVFDHDGAFTIPATKSMASGNALVLGVCVCIFTCYAMTDTPTMLCN